MNLGVKMTFNENFLKSDFKVYPSGDKSHPPKHQLGFGELWAQMKEAFFFY